jgi:hypothetical protein
MLNDGRILVVEYKGAHLAETPDTKEKASIGEIWAKRSKGKALFLLTTVKKSGKTLEAQIKEKIRDLSRVRKIAPPKCLIYVLDSSRDFLSNSGYYKTAI